MNASPSKTSKALIVETPKWLSKQFYRNDLKNKLYKNILDVGCYRGNLSSPFKRKGVKIIGVDVLDEYADLYDNFIHADFLSLTKKDVEGLDIDCVVSNPPFGVVPNTKELYPLLFTLKVFELFGDNMPFLLIAGDWYIRNSSKRMKEFEKWNITKISTLHKSVFQGSNVNVNATAIFFNIKTKKPHEFITAPKEESKRQKTKTIALTQAQEQYISKHMKNFSGEVKQLIRERFPEFP